MQRDAKDEADSGLETEMNAHDGITPGIYTAKRKKEKKKGQAGGEERAIGRASG